MTLMTTEIPAASPAKGSAAPHGIAPPSPAKSLPVNQEDPAYQWHEREAASRERVLRLWNRISFLILPAVGTLLFLALWQIYSATSTTTQIPSPRATYDAVFQKHVLGFFRTDVTSPGIFWALLSSINRVAQGYLLAVVVGVAVGMLIGASQTLYKMFDPLIQVARNIPPLAWLPLSLAFFQASKPAAIFVVFITSVWPILLNTAAGIGRVPQDYRNVAAVLKLSRATYIRRVLFPSAAPYIFTGMRIAVGMGWLAIIAAEMLTNQGIGWFVWDAYNSSNLPEVIIGVIYIGLAGLALDRLIAAAAWLLVVPE